MLMSCTTGGWSEVGPAVKMVCVSINTECHRTCLADVFAVWLLELCQKNI